MCRRVQCSECSRPTYAGCGAHIEQVLANVPKGERCVCREQRASTSTSTSTPAASTKLDARAWLDRVLGK